MPPAGAAPLPLPLALSPFLALSSLSLSVYGAVVYSVWMDATNCFAGEDSTNWKVFTSSRARAPPTHRSWLVGPGRRPPPHTPRSLSAAI